MTEAGDSVLSARGLWAWRYIFILVLTPIVLSPLPAIGHSSESYCGYVILIMAVYWVTESLPISVTALIPLVGFPVFGILSSQDVAVTYMNDVMMLFIGGLMVAIAVEHWNLHKRIALRVLLLVGVEPKWLMLGMMLPTWFLSMWISNTATTAMMMPIMEAILVELKQKGDITELMEVSKEKDLESPAYDVKDDEQPKTEIHTIEFSSTKEVTEAEANEFQARQPKRKEEEDEDDTSGDHRKREHYISMCKGLSLSVCYAANCGGIASLTGTGPNLILKSNVDDLYEDIGEPSPVTFGTWMAFGLPLSAAVLIVCWCWLNLAFLRCRGLCNRCTGVEKMDADQARRVRQVIQHEYDSLGPVLFGQGVVLFLFVTLVVLWVTRDMGGVAGWGSLFDIKVKDGTPAMLVAILLFALPSTIPCLKSYKNALQLDDRATKSQGKNSRESQSTIRPLLNWQVVHEKFPWKLIFLMGGGFAISAGCKESGLSRWVAEELKVFQGWNNWGVLFIFCYITAFATEVMSNTAIATILMPIMTQLALSTEIHPLYFMFPTALACSFAFMLPVATPPNAIVFTFGRVSILDMMKAGIVLNILAVPVLIAMTGSVGDAIFNFADIPAKFLNVSTTTAPTVAMI